MTRFYRIMSSIAVVLIGLGIVLSVIGLLMGGRIGDLSMDPRYGFLPRIWGNDTVEASYTDIHRLDFQFEAMDVEIKPGDSFTIRAERVNSRQFSSYQDGDTWKIHSDNERSPFSKINWGNSWDKKAPRVTITIPESFTADRLDLEMGMGYLSAEGLAADRSEIELGMGEMTLFDFRSGGCDIGVGMGSLVVEGEISGKGSVSCGMGSATMMLIGQQSEYGFDASVGMGSVTIGGHSIEGIGGAMTLNSGAGNFFSVDCGMGSVDIDFRN